MNPSLVVKTLTALKQLLALHRISCSSNWREVETHLLDTALKQLLAVRRISCSSNWREVETHLLDTEILQLNCSVL
jgi:hypothetical protein